jgi:hypothetical protein
VSAPPIHAGHAKARRVVRLQDGRTGVLIHVPIRTGHRRPGTPRAKVALHAAAVIRVPLDELELEPDQ